MVKKLIGIVALGAAGALFLGVAPASAEVGISPTVVAAEAAAPTYVQWSAPTYVQWSAPTYVQW